MLGRNKMKKKFVTMLLALVCAIAMTAFAACNEEDQNEDPTPQGNTYTVTYSLGSCGETAYAGTTALPPSATANEENAHTVVLPAAPVWTGYAFGGWYDGTAKAGDAGASYTAERDVLLTAHWSAIVYALQFDANKPAGVSEEVSGDTTALSVTLQSPSKTLPALSLQGYVFDGWKRDNAGDAVRSFTLTAALIEGLGDATAFRFTAQWTPVPPDQYAVQFEPGADDGTVVGMPNNTSVQAGPYAIPAQEPAREGYTFKGWEVDGDEKIYKKDGVNTEYPVTQSVVFTAKWEKNKYTVTFVYGEGTEEQGETQSVEWGASVSLTEPAPKRGYRFDGWTVEKAQGTVEVTENSFIMPEEPVTVTANWVRVYGVTYSDGVENEMIAVPSDTKEYAAGEPVEISGEEPVRGGYDFTGWKVNDTETVKQKGERVEMTAGGLTLTAQWKPVAPEVTYWEIGFYDYDGVRLLSTVRVKNGDQIVYDKETPTRTQDVQYTYKFAGWSKEKGGAAEPLPTASESTSYYAVYTETLRSYTITFKNGDAVVETVSVNYGERPACSQTVADKDLTQMLVGKHGGWERDGETYTGELPEVHGEATYNAVFEEYLKEGMGTQDTPYPVTEKADLAYLAQETAGGEDFSGKYFELKNEIEAGELASIGTAETPFAGTFDGGAGGEYKIVYTQESGAGLFGNLSGTVKNLKVEATVRGGTVGGVAGKNGGTVENCTATGKVYGTRAAGGLVGENTGTVKFGSSSALVYLNGKLEMSAMAGTEEKAAGVLVGKGGTVKLAEAVWDGTAVSEQLSGDGSSAESPYFIASGADLAYLRDNCASSNSYFAGKYFALAADIDLNWHAWAGIGGGSENNAFAGILDGKDHAIYNVSITGESGRYGFFRSAKGEIKNLVMQGSVINAGDYTGLLVGISYAPIENVTVYADVRGAGSYVGGLVGGTRQNVTNCTAYGLVTGVKAVGGIIGYDFATSGTIGDLTNCTNYATVSIVAVDYGNYNGHGGIVGVIGSGATVEGCKNYGDIFGASGTKCGSGGIVGNLYVSTVQNCYNYGTISSGEYTGGIVGYAKNNSGAGTVTECVNYGAVTGAGQYTGGIVGEGKGITITDCTVEADAVITGTSNVGGIIGCTQSGSVPTITRNTFKGSVTGASDVGGIIGYNSYPLSGCNTAEGAKVSGGFGVGGIVGYNTGTGALTDCDNYAEISCTAGGAGYWIGGIVGVNGAGCTVTSCDNHGAVLSAEKDGNTEAQHGVGGIVGSNYGDGSVVDTCVNYGVVSGRKFLGGIVGDNRNAGAEVKNCENRGNIVCSLEEGEAYVGGLVGYNVGKVAKNKNYGAYEAAEGLQKIDYLVGYSEAGENLVYENTDLHE